MASRDLPHVALSAHAHNREGLHRTDEAWLADQWANPSTRVLVLAGTRLRTVNGRAHWVTPELAPDGLRILLGRRDGVTRFAVVVGAELAQTAEGEGADGAQAAGEGSVKWVGLRGLFGEFTDDGGPQVAPWVFHAIGLAEWHWATRHCPRCGGDLAARAAGHELVCVGCGKSQFPRTDPAVIMAVTHGSPGTAEERILLGRQSVWPPGRWSTLAGFCEPGETLEDAVRREVAEEVGVQVGRVTYFGSQPWPLPASLMVGFTAEALTTEIDVDGSEVEAARWFTREELIDGAHRGEFVVPGAVSISSSLITSWLGTEVPAGW